MTAPAMFGGACAWMLFICRQWSDGSPDPRLRDSGETPVE